jgi:hypothetical protein
MPLSGKATAQQAQQTKTKMKKGVKGLDGCPFCPPPRRATAAEGIARSPKHARGNVLPTRMHPPRRQGSPWIHPTLLKMARWEWL